MKKFECSRVKTLKESELEQVVGGGAVETIEHAICDVLTGDHEHCGGCGSTPSAMHSGGKYDNNLGHDWTLGCGCRHGGSSGSSEHEPPRDRR